MIILTKSRLQTLFAACTLILLATSVQAADASVVYEGGDGVGNGKHIVLVSGDEEYRSEEALPQLGKILARHHGFKCTVLFAIDPATGEIDPNNRHNIPGLEALKTADLMIIATRFRDLRDAQMQHIADYVEAGKPIIGLRTATHAFNIPGGKKFAKYSFDHRGDDYPQGFGRQILGETWINHHGDHGSQSTRGIISDDARSHPIARGLNDGDIWGPSDVYGVRLPLPGDSKPIVLGAVLAGMNANDKPVEGKKNDPMMPIAWTKTYQSDNGKSARVFATTMGASQDLAADGTRRMLVNAVYWTLGMENKIPSEGTNVDVVGDYKPTKFAFDGYTRGIKPRDHALED